MTCLENSIRYSKILKTILFYILLTASNITSSPPIKNAWGEQPSRKIEGRVFIESKDPRFVVEDWRLSGRLLTSNLTFVGDLNGDHASDILFLTSSKTSTERDKSQIYLSNTKNGFYETNWIWGESRIQLGESILHDINSDSCADIIGPDIDSFRTYWVLYSDCKNNFNPSKFDIFSSNIPTKIVLSEYFLDGKIGILLKNANGQYFQLLHSKKDGLSLSQETPKISDEYESIFGVGRFNNRLTPEPIFKLLSTEPAWWIADSFKASFPQFHDWSTGVAGDFNGDSRTDIVAFGSGIMGWWIALSNGITGLERPVAGLSTLNTDTDRLLVGDFDGDGLDDLISKDVLQGDKVKLALSRLSLPLEGARIVTTNPRTEVETDVNGKFNLELTSGANSLAASYQNGIFALNKMEVDPDLLASKPITFLVLKSQAENIIGAEQSLNANTTGPFTCLAYNLYSSGSHNRWGSSSDLCSPGFATYSISEFDTNIPPDATLLHGSCCRLPNPDILENNHVFQKVECPDNFVVTGGKLDGPDPLGKKSVKFIRCTKINLKRYKLGPRKPGTYWGFGLSRKGENDPISLNEIPPAIRHAVGRGSYSTWAPDGCIGQPAGSLLVEKNSAKCAGIHFRQLQYAGLPGDPPTGTPVPMFPKCKQMLNIYDPAAGCLAE